MPLYSPKTNIICSNKKDRKKTALCFLAITKTSKSSAINYPVSSGVICRTHHRHLIRQKGAADKLAATPVPSICDVLLLFS